MASSVSVRRPVFALSAAVPRSTQQRSLGSSGRLAVTERALFDGTVLDGPVRAALLVENLGPYQDLESARGLAPRSCSRLGYCDGALVSAQLHEVPVVDLEISIPRVFGSFGTCGIHPGLKWAVPAFWGEYIEKRALPANGRTILDLITPRH